MLGVSARYFRHDEASAGARKQTQTEELRSAL
jgi:hypothetical protein